MGIEEDASRGRVFDGVPEEVETDLRLRLLESEVKDLDKRVRTMAAVVGSIAVSLAAVAIVAVILI